MSKIEWTDETWNLVTGCSHVSPGCDNCYMFALYPRLRGMGVPGYFATPDTVTLMPERLAEPLKWRRPRMVFVNSMSDTFHPRVPFAYITAAFRVMAFFGQHTFQVLTKRPGRAVYWWEHHGRAVFKEWPLNVWIGTSVESQKYAERLSVLARLPADAVTFVSAEPLLGPLDIRDWVKGPMAQGTTFTDKTGVERYDLDGSPLNYLDWVICGGESGPKARPMEIEWARDLRDQCLNARIPFFLKQLGGRRDKRGGDDALLDGRQWHELPNPVFLYPRLEELRKVNTCYWQEAS